MAKDRQDIVSQRRKPTQARARATIDMIFEATARIIERDGMAALNTNRIAERAGISIGTLYEYFPNKDAILIAMARQRLAEDERLVRQALTGPEADQDVSLAREAIHALVALHEDRPLVWGANAPTLDRFCARRRWRMSRLESEETGSQVEQGN